MLYYTQQHTTKQTQDGHGHGWMYSQESCTVKPQAGRRNQKKWPQSALQHLIRLGWSYWGSIVEVARGYQLHISAAVMKVQLIRQLKIEKQSIFPILLLQG
jgi:hypothetical protein